MSAYAPAMMVRVLLYGYATGTYSSRKMEAKTYDDVAFRYLSADAQATAKEAMRQKLSTEAGRSIYKMRKAIVEPVFGQIKEARGFRRFSLCGLDNVRREWKLVCLTSNLLKLFGSGWTPQAA
jgi:hypothetical protein